MPASGIGFKELSVEITDGVALVTFGSPSLCRSFQEDLWGVVNALEGDANVAVIVFTGRRSVFMTGADLTEVLPLSDRDAADEFLELPHAIVAQFCNSSKILIAAINGYCLGGGLELALTCDLRLVVDQVRNMEGHNVPFLGFPEARVGLIPALGGAYLATEILGLAQAKELFFSAERITAEHALRIGLANAVFGRESLLNEALRIARKIASNSSNSLVLTKRLFQLCPGASLNQALQGTREAFADCCNAGDKDQRIRRSRAEGALRFRNFVSTERT